MQGITKKQIEQAETALFHKMIGYDYEEVKITEEKNGECIIKTKKEVIKKHCPPDTGVILSWLKENAPERWGGKSANVECGVVMLPEIKEGEQD